ncbi:MAG TPA: hypothetical protein VLF93_04870 [Candidatus Saccharimonadales bacterium]|nr:hypothetical protein [Candidatus Saccharimonadales bacterium]
MNGVSNLVKADKIIRWGMTFAFILLLFQAGFLALFFLRLPPSIPLFNQLPWGEDRLGANYEFILPLAITSLFFLFNYILLRKLYTTMPLVSRIIGITTLLASLLSFIFVVRTLQLVL